MIDVVASSSSDYDRPFDAAVAIPTIARPALVQAVHSVFSQSFDGRIQILIGLDRVDGDLGLISKLMEECPDGRVITLFNPGYSTSERNGGFYTSWNGGALRAILTFMAHSRYVAYLDDDNWWHGDHVESLVHAIEGRDWSFSLRWLVDEASDEVLCIDEWHSVGPGKGEFKESLGGFVDPSTIMIDKLSCAPALPLWCFADGRKKDNADRRFARFLCENRNAGATGRPTMFYRMRRTNRLWRKINEKRIGPGAKRVAGNGREGFGLD